MIVYKIREIFFRKESNMEDSTSCDKKQSIVSTIMLPSFPKMKLTHIHSTAAFLIVLLIFFPQFRLLEIEFYVTNDHDDPYTHGHEQQLNCGESVWKEWKWVSRRAVDITFGLNKKKNLRRNIN